MTSNYDDNSIGQLKGAERIRFRPAAVLGSNGIDGARHTIYEIVGNASDEQMSGFGDKLEIGYYEDGSISVRDFGRGVPLGWNEKEQNWNYFLIYEEMYAGGKYGDSQEVLKKISDWNKFDIKDYPYLITVGLNGLGAAATQCTSEYCTVTSYKDGVKRTMKYEKGAHVLEDLLEEATDEPDGTFVHWKPDAEVFTDVNIGAKWVEKLCKSLSYTSDFTVTFNNCGKVKVFERKTMLEHLHEEVDDAVFNTKFTHEVDGAGDVCICFADVAIGNGGAGNEFFHNKVEIQGGVHAEAVNSAEYTFFSDRGSERGIRIKSTDYSGKLSTIVSSLSNKVSYRGQTKDSLDDDYVFRCIEATIREKLELEWSKGTDWVVDVVNEVIQEAENRITVAELSKNVREIEKSVRTAKASEKFKSCDAYDEKDYENVEYWIFEGDSAGNSAKTARDPKFQCTMPVRGKSLNVFKASLEKIVANNEIKDIIAVLGCGVDMGIEGIPTFDINKLKVGKIIFGADADIDGRHIDMLLFLIFYKLFPELLYEGRVYIANSPLYSIEKYDSTFVYCMDEDDLAKKQEEIGSGAIKEITRFKGLGEMNPQDLWNTTMNPATRNLTQIKIDKNDVEVYDVLEMFFGKSTDRRKRAILGSMMGTDFDNTINSIDELLNAIESSDIETDLEIENVSL